MRNDQKKYRSKMQNMQLRRVPTMPRLVASCLLLSSLAVASCGTLGAHYLTHEFMGLDFNSKGLSSEIRNLARHAQAGDKQAQFELGFLFEEGRGVARDLHKAKALYLMAATTNKGQVWVYSPSARGAGRGRVMQIDGGKQQPGLPEAKARLEALANIDGEN